ncbi:hypothetical protein H0H92_004052 [Tricholoma furcatifolium]|nr:hypothetical protein H0H92_004052 [Tricholoma furcatifolium]
MHDFDKHTPASKQDVENCENGANVPENASLDFGKGFERTRWNRTILGRIYDTMMTDEELEDDWNLPEVSKEYIMACLDQQLKRSREIWRAVQSRFDPLVNRMETNEEVMARVCSRDDERLQTVGSRSRRERKYERRRATVKRIILLKSGQDAPDLATWEYFLQLLERLSVDGMSSEEEGTAKMGDAIVPIFRVRLCRWREPVIQEYLQYIDKEAQSEVIRGTKGFKAHPRVPTSEPGSRPAPKNLPRKLYHSGWLRDLEKNFGIEWVNKELEISKDVFELLKFAAS